MLYERVVYHGGRRLGEDDLDGFHEFVAEKLSVF